MSVTFRNIGARNKVQGGTSFGNLTVTKQLTTYEPMIISGNDVLINSVASQLAVDAPFTDKLRGPIEEIVLKQDIDLVNIARVLQPFMANAIIEKEGFVQSIDGLIRTAFIPRVSDLLLQNKAFMDAITSKLISIDLGPYLLGPFLLIRNIQNQIVNRLDEIIPLSYDFIHLLLDEARPYLFQNVGINDLITERIRTYSYTKEVGIPKLYNNVTLKFFNLVLKSKTSTNIEILPTTFTSSRGITRITVTLRDPNSQGILYTLFDKQYAVRPQQGIITISTEGKTILNDTDSDEYVYIGIRSTFTGNMSVEGLIQITSNPIESRLVFLEDTVPMVLEGPGIRSSIVVQNHLGKNDRTYNIDPSKLSVLRFVNGYPIWSYTFLDGLRNMQFTQSLDTTIYVTANIDGIGTLFNYMPGITVTSPPNQAILINKLNVDSTKLWSACLLTLGTATITINGITTDQENNVYVYGVHFGNPLIAYNANGTPFPGVVSVTSLVKTYGNAFIVKYSPAGVYLGNVLVSSEAGFQIINDVYVDSLNNVYFTCNKTFETTCTIKDFNGNNTTTGVAESFVQLIINNANVGLKFGGNFLKVFSYGDTVDFFGRNIKSSLIINSSNEISRKNLLLDTGNAATATDLLFESTGFLNDNIDQLAINSFEWFFMFRTTATVNYKIYVSSAQTLYTSGSIQLPTSIVDTHILVQGDLNSPNVKNWIYITNSTDVKMMSVNEDVYVSYSFFDVSTIFTTTPINGSNVGFEIGDIGQRGKVLVVFDPITLLPTLIGSYIIVS